jgi:hypothetical protein
MMMLMMMVLRSTTSTSTSTTALKQPRSVSIFRPSHAGSYQPIAIVPHNVKRTIGVLHLEFPLFVALIKVPLKRLSSSVLVIVSSKAMKGVVLPATAVQVAIGRKEEFALTVSLSMGVFASIDIPVGKAAGPRAVHFIAFPVTSVFGT